MDRVTIISSGIASYVMQRMVSALRTIHILGQDVSTAALRKFIATT